ncbi:TspO/MBR family protein [Tundrisphaera sp. TA3]|uniref:TspO/MBR family protein n=1 Tax=Tundrisphaera sp. TA3 TaxID=3435775 RepID=UPI003EB86612
MSVPAASTTTGRAGRDALALAGFVALCFAVAGLGGYWSSRGLGPWYDGLAKPAWTPPGWLFGPVWTALYLAMAVAAWLVWRRGPSPARQGSLVLFGVQLALNLAWSGIFFALRSPGPAFVEIAVLWVAIAATIAAFARTSRPAAALLVPYLAWVTFASALNFAIWRLNA